MNPTVPQERFVRAKAPEAQVHETSREGHQSPTNPSNAEQYPRLVKKPKLSHTMSPESAECIVFSLRASTTPTIGRIGHDSTQGSLPFGEQTDTPRQSGPSRDRFDQATEATSLTTQEEEDHPHLVVWNRDFAEVTEHVLNRDWDLAHVGSFVDHEATTKALLATPEDVLDTVRVRLGNVLKEAETVFLNLKPVLEGAEHSHI